MPGNFDQRDEVWKARGMRTTKPIFRKCWQRNLFFGGNASMTFHKSYALTASGSAISGWTLWNEPNFKGLWLAIAGLGAVLAIVHKCLNVSRRIGDWGSVRSTSSIVRIDFETLLDQMRFDPQFSIETFSKWLADLRKRYADAYQGVKVDAFITDRLRIAVQNELNSTV